jgi:hypothetical protein
MAAKEPSLSSSRDHSGGGYGETRVVVRGKRLADLMFFRPAIQRVTLSTPIPNPE